jgi:hypothetical protein
MVPATKWTWWIAGGVVAIGVLAFSIFRWQPAASTDVAAQNRQHYAALYQAAWRQDDGHQPTLVTATLLTPPAIALLGQDAHRSTSEEQLWQIVKNLSNRQLAFVVTADSVVAAIPDEQFEQHLTMSLGGTSSSTLTSWTSMIAPSRVGTPTSTTTSQIGVAIFDVPNPITWMTLGQITLTFDGIPGEPARIFSWANPNLLLQV